MRAFAPQPAVSVPPTLSAIAYVGGGVVGAVGSRCAGVPEVCRGVVLRTTDGGAQWRLAAATAGPLTHVAALGPTFLWAWGPDDAFASEDGSAHWPALALPAVPHGRPAVVFVSLASAEDGWLATGGLAGGGCAATGCATTLYGTSDGGRRWTPLSSTGLLGLGVTGAPASLPWGEYMAGDDEGSGRGCLLIDGARGAVVVTRDDDRHWSTTVTLNTGGAPVKAAGAGGLGRAWAATRICGPTTCGEGSALYFSNDGGQAWTAAGRGRRWRRWAVGWGADSAVDGADGHIHAPLTPVAPGRVRAAPSPSGRRGARPCTHATRGSPHAPSWRSAPAGTAEASPPLAWSQPPYAGP